MNRKVEKEAKTILKIGSLNCHGMRDRVDYLDFYKLVSKNDIFGVSETWLKKEDKVSLPGFEFYPLNRGEQVGPTRGGIGIFISDKIRKYVKIRYDLSSENFLVCRILKKFMGYNDDVYIAIIYIPPETSTREKRLKKDHFKQLVTSTSKTSNLEVGLAKQLMDDNG